MLSSLICGILLSLEHVWPSPDMLKRIIDMPLHVLESRQSLNQVSMIARKRFAINILLIKLSWSTFRLIFDKSNSQYDIVCRKPWIPV